MKLYDESAMREMSRDEGGEERVDIFYLHVRLFRLGEEGEEVYLLVQAYESWVGEVGPKRGPRCYRERRTYFTGPDSLRIRHAIARLDAFGGERSWDSR